MANLDYGIIRAHFFVSSFTFLTLVWKITQKFKDIFFVDLYDKKMSVWTHLFFHPKDSCLLNYLIIMVISCIVFFFNFILIKKDVRIVKMHKTGIASVSLFLSIFALILLRNEIPLYILLLITAAPFLILINYGSLPFRLIFFITFFLIAFILVYEPLNVMISKKYLMNEYPDIYSTTKFRDGQKRENKSFIENIDAEKMRSIRIFYALLQMKEKKTVLNLETDGLDFLKDYRYENLNWIKDAFIADLEINGLYIETVDIATYSLKSEIEKIGIWKLIDNLKNVDLEELKYFYFVNELEYNHQNMGRGQINHICQILIPINEYNNGKEFSRIYFQYGIGNTLLMKKIMEMFGDISFGSYYMVYVLYIVYFVLFFWMASCIFRGNMISIIGSLLIYLFSFLANGYVGFMLAPGIIPSLHMYDAPIIILLFMFLKNNNGYVLALIFMTLFLSIINNAFYGIFLWVAAAIMFFFYIVENKDGSVRRKMLFFLFLSCSLFLLISVYVIKISNPDFSPVLYFLKGYFSWKPLSHIVILTFLFITGSYSLIFYSKRIVCIERYLIIFLFLYSQALLLYYYWSGLTSHVLTFLPFFALEYFLSYELISIWIKDKSRFLRYVLNISLVCFFLISLPLVFLGAKKFFAEKIRFYANFNKHQTYQITHPKMNIVSTINPHRLNEASEMIKKYSQDQSGIYILSKYDNLLPFISGKYSLLPHFELGYSLIEDTEINKVLSLFNEKKPPIIFCDSEMGQLDLWSRIYNSEFARNERASRMNRDIEVYKIFNLIKDDYERIDHGALVSVYSRRKEK